MFVCIYKENVNEVLGCNKKKKMLEITFKSHKRVDEHFFVRQLRLEERKAGGKCAAAVASAGRQNQVVAEGISVIFKIVVQQFNSPFCCVWEHVCVCVCVCHLRLKLHAAGDLSSKY